MQLTQRQRAAALWILLALATAFCAFVLPLQFPPKTPSYSASYAVGFNNHIASMAVIFLSFCALFLCWRFDLAGAPQSTQEKSMRMPLRWLAYASLSMLLFVDLQGGLALATDGFESDAAYFLTQLTQWSRFHGHLYTGFEFSYGPLLFAWPAAFQIVLARVHIGAESSYLASLAALHVLGLGTTFCLLQKLPLSRSIKGWVLLALTLGAMRPSLGLNYTLFRFTAPLASLLFIATVQQTPAQILLFVAAQPLMLAISPDIGIAFFAGATGFALHQAWRRSPRWLLLPAPCLLSGLFFVAAIGPGYFFSMRRFAGGMLNMVVAPTPQILLLLLCAIALAPMAVVIAIRQQHPEAPAIAALYMAALALVPAALGICDGLHLFFNGIGLYLLAFVAVAQRRLRWSGLLALALLLIAMPTYVQYIPAAMANFASRQARLSQEDRQVAQWEHESNGAPIFAPGVLSLHMRRKLLADGYLQPDYFSGLDGAFDPSAEQIKAREMQQAAFVLVPDGTLLPPTPDERRRLRILRFGYRYPIRYPAYLPFQELRTEALTRAIPVDSGHNTSGNTLYRLK